MDDLNGKGTVYSTAPLAADTEIVGFPVLTIWIQAPTDSDLFAFLEEVDGQGRSVRLCDGAIRLADAALGEAPFANGSLPWHPCLSGTVKADGGAVGPLRVDWSLFPLSNLVRKGHRLRLLLSGHDGAGWDSAPGAAGSEIRILHEPGHLSQLSLPIQAASL